MRACCFLSTSKNFFILIGALLLGGCAVGKSVPIPTAKHVEYAERNGQPSSLAALALGRKLFINRCSDCHSLKKPAMLAPGEWPEMVERMTENAKLNADQQRLIIQYLVAVSAAAQDGNLAGMDKPGEAQPAPAHGPLNGQ